MEIVLTEKVLGTLAVGLTGAALAFARRFLTDVVCLEAFSVFIASVFAILALANLFLVLSSLVFVLELVFVSSVIFFWYAFSNL